VQHLHCWWLKVDHQTNQRTRLNQLSGGLDPYSPWRSYRRSTPGFSSKHHSRWIHPTHPLCSGTVDVRGMFIYVWQIAALFIRSKKSPNAVSTQSYCRKLFPQDLSFQPSPFLLTLPTPPVPWRTINQRAVLQTMSFSSSAESSRPLRLSSWLLSDGVNEGSLVSPSSLTPPCPGIEPSTCRDYGVKLRIEI